MLMPSSRAALAFKVLLPLSLVAILLFHLSNADGTTSYLPLSKSKPSLPRVVNHGASRCAPEVTNDLLEKALAWNTSCQNFAPFPRNPLDSRVAKVMLHYGTMKPHYARALETHVLHSIVHNTDLHIQCDALAGEWKMYNKQAFLLAILLEQMTLPEKDRYEWLFYIDLDSMVLDQCRPLSTFLPPSPSQMITNSRAARGIHNRRDKDSNAHSDIHLISAEDHHGINAGIFFIRVSAWSVEFLEAVLARRFYIPDEKLTWGEQSAMGELLKTPQFSSGNAFVPQYWFNAYRYAQLGPEKYRNMGEGEKLLENQARRGDFMMHFAGAKDKQATMTEWIDGLEGAENVWEKGVLRDVSAEAKKFWEEMG